MLAVKVRLLRVRDEELGFVRIGIISRVGHGDDTSSVKLAITRYADQMRNYQERISTRTDFERCPNFVREWCAPDALAAFASARWVTCLDHEPPYVTVEYTIIKVARCA